MRAAGETRGVIGLLGAPCAREELVKSQGRNKGRGSGGENRSTVRENVDGECFKKAHCINIPFLKALTTLVRSELDSWRWSSSPCEDNAYFILR